MKTPTLESDKNECVLDINSFNKPAATKGKSAWVNLILNLLFMKKGMYPSMPLMGVGIQYYEYEFIDEIQERLQQEIQQQIKQFLPDVPLQSVSISSTEAVNGETVLLVVISFYITEGTVDTAVVALKKGGIDLTEFAINF